MNIRNLFASAAVLGAATISMSAAQAQQTPTLLDPTLKLETLVNSGIPIATSMAFINSTDYIVATKSAGKIRLFANGQTPVDLTFDIPAATWANVSAGSYPNLPVNSISERGLLCVYIRNRIEHWCKCNSGWLIGNSDRAIQCHSSWKPR